MCDAFVLILSVSNLFDGKFLTCHHKISKNVDDISLQFYECFIKVERVHLIDYGPFLRNGSADAHLSES